MFFYEQFFKVIYISILLEKGRHYTIHKKVRKIKNKTIGQSAFYQSYQKHLKECLYKWVLFFEEIFNKQLYRFSKGYKDISNKQQCRFRKGYNTQQCLLKMLERWKQSVDGGKLFGALVTHLSKAFDCLDHELLIAKLNAYVLVYLL